MDGKRKGLLLVIQDGKVVETLPLTRETTLIGRDQGDIIIDDAEISGSHCQLKWLADEWHLFDLSSTNGTFLNGSRILKSKLKEGDLIRIGHVELKFSVTLKASRNAPLVKATGLEHHKSKVDTQREERVQAPEKVFPPDILTQSVLALLAENKARCLSKAALLVEAVYHDGESESLEVPERAFLMGRLTIEGRFDQDEELSRKHAHAEVTPDGEIELTDLGSTNGTFVNEEKLEGTRTITHKDSVRIGRTFVRFSLRLKPT